MADTDTTTAPTEEHLTALANLASALNSIADQADELDQDDTAFGLRTLSLKVTKAHRAGVRDAKRAAGEAVRGAKPKPNNGK